MSPTENAFLGILNPVFFRFAEILFALMYLRKERILTLLGWCLQYHPSCSATVYLHPIR